MLAQFSRDEIEDMADGNIIAVTCEFCNTSYQFEASRYLKPSSE
jgi:redox-regulated HSP33 family molecular chaperone